MGIVICRLPKAGLGNQLFPLMNALVFAKLNDLKIIITGYHHFKIGPYLRKEKIKRTYFGYFVFHQSFLRDALQRIKILIYLLVYKRWDEPKVEKCDPTLLKGKVLIFQALPTYFDYFIHLKQHWALVKQLLLENISLNVLKEIKAINNPVIGLHVRMGDFRKLKPGEDFSKVGHVRTPEEYFIDLVKEIRTLKNCELPVSLFTDGFRSEFEHLFNMNNISLVEGHKDIVDLMVLSNSKIIITANGSTFSYWAAFLSEAPVIKHPDHLYASFRPEYINKIYYEGPLFKNSCDELLYSNIQAIELLG